MQSANSETCTSVIKEPPCVKTQKHDEMQYLDLIQYILDNGTKKEDRTGRMEIFISEKHVGGRHGADVVIIVSQTFFQIFNQEIGESVA